MTDPALVAVVIAATLGFAFTNGFHDASNSVATAVTTRALTPAAAIALAATMNAVGALLSTRLALLVGFGLVDPPTGRSGLLLVLAGVLGATLWNLLTWWHGMPSSSSQALIAGLAGATLLAPGMLDGAAIALQVAVPMLLSPVLGFLLAWLGMAAVTRLRAERDYSATVRGFRYAQTLSGAALALGHGLQDAQKSMGVILLALSLAGGDHDAALPWAVVSCAGALAAGTAAGGWRVTRTLSRRITAIDPPRGFVAEAVSALLLAVSALAFRVPASTTHTVTSSIVATGVHRGVRSVRWRTVGRIALTWLITPFAAAVFAAILRVLLLPFG
ncbi:MAG TPA: anion permease [Actinomycetaceae bacterium]|nr:anion permease [Actinomycetaceae bacterium]